MSQSQLVATIRYWQAGGATHEEELVLDPQDAIAALSSELAYFENEIHRELVSVKEFIDGNEVVGSITAARVAQSSIDRAEVLMGFYEDEEEDSAWNKTNNKWS